MRTPTDVIDCLRERHLYDLCESIAGECGVPLREVVWTKIRYAEVVDARHAIWVAVYRELGNVSATARIFGVDHSSVLNAMRKLMTPFARVELASSSREFEVDGEVVRHSCRLEWVKRKGKPFAVIDSITESTSWHDTHATAHGCYQRLCEALEARARSAELETREARARSLELMRGGYADVAGGAVAR